MVWVLIMSLVFTNVGFNKASGGAGITTAEFTTQKTCISAGINFTKVTTPPFKVKFICAPK